MTPFAVTITHFFAVSSAVLFIGAVTALYGAYGKGEQAGRVRKFAWFAPYAAFITALISMIGSLLYSEIIGFPPCSLCYVQRWFMYPSILILFPWTILLGQDLKLKVNHFFNLSIALSAIGGTIALYHAYTQVGGSSFLPCTTEGGDCSRVYFAEWGFMTIPAMSFIAFFAIISFLLLARMYYDKKEYI